MSVNLKTNHNLTGILLAGGKSKRPGFNKIEIRIDNVPLFIDQIFKLGFFCNEILISASENNYDFISYEINKIKDYNANYYKFCSSAKIPPLRIIMDKDRSKPQSQSNYDRNSASMGPVSGLESGLEHAGNFYSLVMAFDMPFIAYNLLCLLEEIKNSQNKPRDAFIIKTEKGYESLCGIYSKNCLNAIRKNIAKKIYKISEIFPDIDTLFIPLDRIIMKRDNNNISFYELNNRRIDSLNFFNINTADDYSYFNKIWDLQVFSNQEFSKQISLKYGDKPAYIFCEKWKYFFYR